MSERTNGASTKKVLDDTATEVEDLSSEFHGSSKNNGVTESAKDRAFSVSQMAALRKKFDALAGEDGEVHLSTFHQLLDSRMPPTLATKLFAQLAENEIAETISFEQFVRGMRVCCEQSWQEQARFVFGLFDLDGNGTMDKAELMTALTKAAALSALEMPKKTVDKLFASLCTALGMQESGSCSLEQLLDTLEKHAYLRPAFSFHPLQFLVPPDSEISKSSKSSKSSKTLDASLDLAPALQITEDAIEHAIHDLETKGFRGFDLICWLWVAGYVAGSIALAVTAAKKYADLGLGMRVQIARAGGANLNFHAVLLLATMLRNSCTFLNYFPVLSRLFPLAVTVPMHKGIAVMNLLWTCVHTIGHGINYGQAFDYQKGVNYVFTNKNEQGWVENVSAGATGFALFIVLLTMIAGYVLAHNSYIQKKVTWAFEIFYFSHFLCFIYFILMFIHAPHSKWWLCGPFGLYLVEWIFRLCRRSFPAHIINAKSLPCGAVMLELERPVMFGAWQAGAYAFINIPEISPWEWHPFTISSAARRPGNTIVFNIKSQGKGTWTGKLAAAIENKGVIPEDSKLKRWNSKYEQEVSTRKDWNYEKAAWKQLTVHLDGPYGAPTQAVFQYKHSIIVGAGIGVTPSGAVLDSVFHRCKDPSQYGKGDPRHVHNLHKLERLDFCWLNNDLDCTEWFTPLLASIEEEIEAHPDETLANLIHTHIFLTSLNSKAEKEAVAIHLAIDALTATDDIAAGFDFESHKTTHPIIGLKEKIHPGRPNWPVLLKHLKEQSAHPDDMCVFFCGPPVVGLGIAEAAIPLGIKFQQEVF